MEARAFVDTHVLVWMYEKKLDLFPDKSARLLRQVELWVSPICLMEVDFLREVKKIQMGGQAMFEGLQKSLRIQLAPDPLAAIVAASSQLGWTRDPFDRLIVAQAALKNTPLITRDRKILEHYRHSVWD